MPRVLVKKRTGGEMSTRQVFDPGTSWEWDSPRDPFDETYDETISRLAAEDRRQWLEEWLDASFEMVSHYREEDPAEEADPVDAAAERRERCRRAELRRYQRQYGNSWKRHRMNQWRRHGSLRRLDGSSSEPGDSAFITARAWTIPVERNRGGADP